MTKTILLAGAAGLLAGCVAEAPYAVAPGPGKTYAEFQRDDAACRTPAAAAPAGASASAQVSGDLYYRCMAARGEIVSATPAYAAYPAVAAAPYPYPAYPYAAYPYGYPYTWPYVAPSIGIGIGFGIGYRDWGWDRGHWEGGGWDHERWGGWHGDGHFGGRR